MIRAKYFYDFEFLEDGVTIDPISVGVVCDDGREYYAVNKDASWLRILKHEWLMDNVVPHLPVLPRDQWFNNNVYADILDETNPAVKRRQTIAQEVREFLLADGLGADRASRELWAWYASYDHVALAQLWGRMIDIPEGIPMFTNDLKSEAVRLGSPEMPNQWGSEHNALDDARYNKHMFDFMLAVESRKIAEASSRVACCPMDEETAFELILAMRR